MVTLSLIGSPSIYVAIAISLVISFVAVINLINKNANPEYKITWLIVILMFMPFGAFMYALFYTRRMSRKESLLLTGAMLQMKSHGTRDGEYESLRKEDARAAGQARSIMNDDMLAELYRGTSSVLFPTGEKYFEFCYKVVCPVVLVIVLFAQLTDFFG